MTKTTRIKRQIKIKQKKLITTKKQDKSAENKSDSKKPIKGEENKPERTTAEIIQDLETTTTEVENSSNAFTTTNPPSYIFYVNQTSDAFNDTLYYDFNETSYDYYDDDDNTTIDANATVIIDYMTEEELKEFLEKYKGHIETDEKYDNTSWHDEELAHNTTNTTESGATEEDDPESLLFLNTGAPTHGMSLNGDQYEVLTTTTGKSDIVVTTINISENETISEKTGESEIVSENNIESAHNETNQSPEKQVHHSSDISEAETEGGKKQITNKGTEADPTTTKDESNAAETADKRIKRTSHAEEEGHRGLNDYSHLYETLIKSNELTVGDKLHLGDLERLRRSLDALGGIEALRGDPKTHHIVKRQLDGTEACGAFSKRRRREVGPKVFQMKTIGRLAEDSTGSGDRHKRGISNVGKRLEKGNPGFKQLYNQYKYMCNFIAMVAFEK